MTDNKLKGVEFFRRADGVNGVGYRIQHAGKLQWSVAWPDKPAERYLDDELERKHIRRESEGSDTASELSKPAEINQDGKPSETVTKRTVDQVWENRDQPEPVATDPSVADLSEEDAADEAAAESDSKADDQAEPETNEQSQESVSEAEAIRQYLAEHPDAHNRDVIKALGELDMKVTSSQVSRERKKLA